MLLLLLTTALATKAMDNSGLDAETPQIGGQEPDGWDEDMWLAEMAQKLFPAPQYVDVVFVGDRSGSMSQYQGSSQAGTREFMEKHRDNAIRSAADETINGVKSHMTIVTFDSRKERPFSGDADNVTPDDIERCVNAMRPRNSTRLFDTAIEEIDEQTRRMIEKENEGYTVHAVFALLTDGQDNDSRSTRHDLRAAITQHEARGVTCMFVQAGSDALRVGAQYGFAGARTLEMGREPEHAMSSIRAVSAQTTEYTRQATLSAVPSVSASSAPRPPTVGPIASAPARGAYDDDEDYDDFDARAMPAPCLRSMSSAPPPSFSVMERISSAPSRAPARDDYDHGYDLRVRSDATTYNMPAAPAALTRQAAVQRSMQRFDDMEEGDEPAQD